MNFTVIDCIFFVLLLIFAFGAMSKGFIEEFFSKASWVLGLICGYLFYKTLAQQISVSITNEMLAKVVSFLIIFVGVFLIVKIIGAIIGKIFEVNILNSLDHALGFFFGIVEGLAIIFLIMFIILVQPFFPVDSLVSNSLFFNIFGQFVTDSTNEIRGITSNV